MASPPVPDLILETLNAYQRTEALTAAIDLDLFTHVAAGHRTCGVLAEQCGASGRGVRILSDYLVVLGLLVKTGAEYDLTPEAARFLDRRSDNYLGRANNFLGSPFIRRGFSFLASAVRKGGTALEQAGTISPEHEVWVEFARGMAPVMAPTAVAVADLLEAEAVEPSRILDLAAGHGLFGITVAARNPDATVCAVDWPHVLAVARENASAAGVGPRFRTLEGSAFDVEFGHDFDLVLMTNFLHHFDRGACVRVLRKAHRALTGAGRTVLLEYVPNDDRISPPRAASFALTMLATTPDGDAYTFAEYREMLADAGFANSSFHQLTGSNHQLIIGAK